MRLIHTAALALVLSAGLADPCRAQAPAETSRPVAGGIGVQGWTGKIDASEEKAGRALADAKLAGTPAKLEVTTGPAVTYWDPANTASGTSRVTTLPAPITAREPMLTPARMIAPPPTQTFDPMSIGLPYSSRRRCSALNGCNGV